jgi:hypothetical protein
MDNFSSEYRSSIQIPFIMMPEGFLHSRKLRLPPGFIDTDVTQLGFHELSPGSFMVKAIEVFEIASGSS